MNKIIKLNMKEYSLLERSIRGDVSLSHKLSNNIPISKNELIMELIEEIRSLEFDEDEGTSLEFRIYEPGRGLLRTITKKLYSDEPERYFRYLSKKELINLNEFDNDIMITISIV